MKALTLIVIALVVNCCSAYLIKVPSLPLKPPSKTLAPVWWVQIQKLLLPLFNNVCEDSTNDIVVRLAKEFTLDAFNGDFTNTDVITNLKNIKTDKGFLPKGQIFSEYNTSHYNELKALFEVLYYAKDFDTFYKAACWARQNINCGLFVDALYAAVMIRKDTYRISIPAPYEILPNYFIRKDTIIKASSLLSGIKPDKTVEEFRVENNAYILNTNYTTDLNDNEDSELVYFREDIGLNSYYYLKKLRNTLRLSNAPDVIDYYGEYMFTMMKQFAARYDLERYSNRLAALESIKWDSIVPMYKPMLIYSNGNEFGQRTALNSLGDSQEVVFLKTIENNIASVVTHLKQAGHDKSQIINHLIEILITADKSYESVAKQILGTDIGLSERQYSTLEHYLTTLRDPVYWKVNKKIVELIDNGLKVLPSYSRKELYFPGVEVLNVEVKKMMTSFDLFYFDVTDSLKSSVENTTYQVKIAQRRLNHKPFSIKLNISSLVSQKGVVKIYLGPKTIPGQLTSRKNSFIILDKFDYEFKRGINILSRSSDEMYYSADLISYPELQKKVEDSEFGLNALPLKEVEAQIRFPSRLILPKGLSEGLELQLFIFVAPYYKNIEGSLSSVTKEFNAAIMSPGYPFDLAIDEKTIFRLPNSLVKDINITHKDASKSSSYEGKTGPKKWDSENSYNSRTYSRNDDINNEDLHENGEQDIYFDYKEYNEHNLLSERPIFTYKNNKSNDYTAKWNQFKNKENLTIKQKEYEKPNVVSNTETTVPQTTSKEFNKYNLEEKIKKPLSSNVINKNEMRNFSKEDNFVNTDVKQSSVEKVHGLLGDRLVSIYKNKQFPNKKEDYETKSMQYKNRDYRKKVSDELIYQKQTLATKEKQNFKSTTYSPKLEEIGEEIKKHENEKDISGNIIGKPDVNQTSVENVNGLLGERPDFTYKNKRKTDYTDKRNQFKNKKENYEAKRAEYENKEYRKKLSGVLFITEQEMTTKDEPQIKSTTHSTQFIEIDDGNSVVHKNILEDKIDKKLYVDKVNTDRLDIDTIVNPVTYIINEKIDEEIITEPGAVLTDSSSSIEKATKDSEYMIISEPVPEVPKRRVTVYDYLFNFGNDENRVYE